MELQTPDIWADPLNIAGNQVRQLLVPSAQVRVDPSRPTSRAENRFGSWPITSSTHGEMDLSLRVTPTLNSRSRVEWVGDRSFARPDEVIASWDGSLSFGTVDGSDLRRPQLGALHASVGHLLSGVTSPGLVVMPTGTGKSETMLAITVAACIKRLLVIVPSTDLRDQICMKFLRLGLLQELGVVSPVAQRPIVASLEHGLPTEAEAQELMRCANVVVSTPAALRACGPHARATLLACFTHLMVDEAHHTPATSWQEIVSAFDNRPIPLFTATPHRETARPSLAGPSTGSPCAKLSWRGTSPRSTTKPSSIWWLPTVRSQCKPLPDCGPTSLRVTIMSSWPGSVASRGPMRSWSTTAPWQAI